MYMIIIHLAIFLKLFFIGYARGWCEAKTLGDLVGQLQGDPHPPAMVRVLLTLKNNEDFHQAFQCQAGDRMISENPCRVW
jgi:predicted metalloendopeptidase